MPGTVPQGTTNRIRVGTTPTAVGTNTVIGRLQQWEFGQESETQKEEFYNGDASLTSVGTPVYDGTGSGKWADGDPGLIIVKAAATTQDLIGFGVVPNGVDGEGVPGRISRFRLTGAGVRTTANYQFSFVQDGVPYDIGGGLT